MQSNHRTCDWHEAEPVPGDYDGNGKDDLAYYDMETLKLHVRPSLDDPESEYSEFAGMRGKNPITGDFDGDGCYDMGTYEPKSGKWYFVNTKDGFDTKTFGYAGTVPIVGDFDGDRTNDYGCYDAAGIPGLALPGSWYFRQSTDGFVINTFGYAGTVPVVGDFDGDGTDDYGCYDAAGNYGQPPGSWYIMQSSAGFRTETFGYAGTVPVVTDYDGDETDDLACYDAAGIPGLVDPGLWYITESTDGFRTETFGWHEAEPVPGDYDGDGKANLAVRGPGSKFYIEGVAGPVIFGW